MCYFSAVESLCNLPPILDREAAGRLPPLRQHAGIHPRYSDGSCSDVETPAARSAGQGLEVGVEIPHRLEHPRAKQRGKSYDRRHGSEDSNSAH